MKHRKATLLLALMCVVVGTIWLIADSSGPNVDTLDDVKLSAAADQLVLRVPPGTVPQGEWPSEMRRIKPLGVRIGAEGVYLKMQSFFATEKGIFIHNTNSSFRPEKDGDPSYRPLRGKIYWYEIKG